MSPQYLWGGQWLQCDGTVRNAVPPLLKFGNLRSAFSENSFGSSMKQKIHVYGNMRIQKGVIPPEPPSLAPWGGVGIRPWFLPSTIALYFGPHPMKNVDVYPPQILPIHHCIYMATNKQNVCPQNTLNLTYIKVESRILLRGSNLRNIGSGAPN